MKNLVFALWMALYPAAALCTYVLEVKLKRRYGPLTRALGAAFDLVTWIAVGVLLYEP